MIYADNFDDDMVDYVRNVDGVADAEARALVRPDGAHRAGRMEPHGRCGPSPILSK